MNISNKRTRSNKKTRLATLIRSSIFGSAVLLSCSLNMSSVDATGPISFTGPTYTQDFQSMSATPFSAEVAPTSMLEVSSLDGGGSVDGWYLYHQAGGSNGGIPKWSRSTGTSSTGSFYAMYDFQSTPNIALGAQGSSNVVEFFGLVLQNNTGSVINQFNISYDAMIARNPNNTVNAYPLSWMVSSTAPAAGTATGAGTMNDAAGTWNTSTFGFTTPSTGIGAPASVTGSQSAIDPLFRIDGASKGGTVSAANWLPGQYLYIRWKETDETSSDATAGVDNFSFAQVVVATVKWNTASGNWNTTSGNWVNGSPTPSLYKDTDNAVFDNSATGGTVTVAAGGVSPLSTLVNNDAAHPYVFQSADANGIKTGDFTKTGVGTATLSGANTFTGGTHINGGTLVVNGGDDRLGHVSGAVGFGGGTLRTDGVGLTTTRGIVVGTGGGTFNTNGFDSSLSGTGTINDSLIKTGSGDLTLSGSLFFGPSGSLNVDAGGTLTLVAVSGTTSIYNGGVYNGDLVINSTARLNFNTAGKTYGGTGKIKVLGTSVGVGVGSATIAAGELPNTSALFSNLSGQTAGTITSDIVLNPAGTGHVAFTPGDVTTSNYTTASFLMFVGGTNGATGDGLTINGKISGEGDLFIGNSSRNGGGSANITFNNANTYTGNTLINNGGIIKIGVTNALPITTNVVQGSLNNAGNATLDLNGFNQQIASLSDDAQNASIAKNLTITNNGLADSTLTISGSVTPANAFNGTIVDGATNKVGLTKGGTNTITLGGANTYGGNTTVNGGILNVASTGSITSSTGNLSVGDGAFVLGGSASVQNTVNTAGIGTIHVQSTGTLTSNNLLADYATIDGTATVRVNGGAAGASKIETLNIGAAGKLNLKDNDLVVGTAANVDAVRAAIKTGVAGSLGITSDLPAFGVTTGFGYALGNDSAISPLLAGSLAGQSYDADSVLVKYTFLGDADLDGDSDLNDLGLWAQSFTGDLGNPATPATYWTSGDFDYDGDTDLNDLGFWAGTFTGDLGGGAGSLIVVAPNAPAGAVAALNSMGITVVPEPSTFILAGVGLAGLAIASRRRKLASRSA